MTNLDFLFDDLNMDDILEHDPSVVVENFARPVEAYFDIVQPNSKYTKETLGAWAAGCFVVRHDGKSYVFNNALPFYTVASLTDWVDSKPIKRRVFRPKVEQGQARVTKCASPNGVTPYSSYIPTMSQVQDNPAAHIIPYTDDAGVTRPHIIGYNIVHNTVRLDNEPEFDIIPVSPENICASCPLSRWQGGQMYCDSQDVWLLYVPPTPARLLGDQGVVESYDELVEAEWPGGLVLFIAGNFTVAQIGIGSTSKKERYVKYRNEMKWAYGLEKAFSVNKKTGVSPAFPDGLPSIKKATDGDGGQRIDEAPGVSFYLENIKWPTMHKATVDTGKGATVQVFHIAPGPRDMTPLEYLQYRAAFAKAQQEDYVGQLRSVDSMIEAAAKKLGDGIGRRALELAPGTVAEDITDGEIMDLLDDNL